MPASSRAHPADRTQKGGEPPIYLHSLWVRVDEGGILLARVKLGDRVTLGDTLGMVTDPLSNERTLVRAPRSGRVIGMAVDQVVIPGFAAFHLATERAQPNAPIPVDRESVDSGGAPHGGALPYAIELE